MSQVISGAPLWDSLEAASTGEAEEGSDIYERARVASDSAQYRPKAVSGVIVTEVPAASGSVTILKNPIKYSYLRLTAEDRFVWEQMNGARTVKDIVVAYFMKFGAFAFARVASLTEELRKSHFLEDPPADVYESVRTELSKAEGSYYLRKMRETFIQRTISLNGVDGFLSAMYRFLIWPLYTKAGKAVMGLASILGAALYVWLLATGPYSAFETAGSYSLGMLTYLAIGVFIIAVHEGAHAFTTKSYGREVPRGGFVLYWGSPCFFADTSDIWLEPKGRRIAVSWAGPYSEFVLAGLLAIAMVALPDNPANNVIFKIAFFCYVSTIMNLNPLLELDGYFILVDFLEMPMLRKRSLDFVREKLIAKIRAKDTFNREERIFTVFGILAGAWSISVVGMSFYLYRFQVRSFIEGLLAGKDPLAIVFSILAFIVFLGPITLGLVSMTLTAAMKVWHFIVDSPLWDRTRNLMLALVCVSIGLGAAATFVPEMNDLLVRAGLEVIILLAAFVSFAFVFPLIRGASLEAPHRMLQLALILLLASRLALAALDVWPGAGQEAPEGLLILSAFPLLVFAGGLFAVHHLRGIGRPQQLILVGVPLAAVALFARDPASATPVFALLLAAALLVPNVVVYRRSDFVHAALVALGGVVLLAISLWLEAAHTPIPALDLVAVGLLASYVALTLRVLRRFQYRREKTSAQDLLGDRERLQSALVGIVKTLLRWVGELLGEHSVREVRDGFNLQAIAAGWGVLLREDGVDLRSTGGVGVVELGRRYHLALDALTGLVARFAGRPFIDRALKGAYDQLHWFERETASAYLFSGTDWGNGLASTFEKTRRSQLQILSGVPLFAGLDPSELSSIAGALGEQRVDAGTAIVQQGDPGDAMYILVEGEVEVLVKASEDAPTEQVARLVRGDFFGEIAVLEDVPRTATVRAVTPVTLYVLGRSALQGAVKEKLVTERKLRERFRHYDFLKRLPLFRELEPQQFARIAGEITVREASAGEVLVTQGRPGEALFTIETGRAEVVVSAEGDTERKVAELGPGEYFGEISLLLAQETTATVRALAAMTLLVLPREAFAELLERHMLTSRNLDRTASRRLQDLQRKVGRP